MQNLDMLLKENQELSSVLFSQSQEGIFIVQDAKIITYNKSFLTITGRTEKEIEDTPLFNFVHPEDRETVRDIHTRRLQGRYAPDSYVFRILKKDEDVLWVRLNTCMISYKNKAAVMVFILPQTEHNLLMRLEYELAVSNASKALLRGRRDAVQATLRYLLQACRVGRIYIFENFDDAETGISMRQTHEVCAEGVIPQIDNPVLQHVPYKEGFGRWREELSNRRIISGTIDDFPPSEQEILGPQGIVSLLVLPIFIKDQWYGFIGFDDIKYPRHWPDADVTLLQTAAEMIGNYLEQKRFEKNLESTLRQMTTIIETIPGSLTVMDTDYRILAANNSARMMRRIKDGAEMIGSRCYDYYYNRRSVCPWCVIPDVLRSGKPSSIISTPGDIREQKTGKAVKIFTAPIQDNEGAITSIIEYMVDISDLRKKEEEAIRLKDFAEAANRTKSEFLANMSHEIRTPLNGVLGFLHLLSGEELTPVQQEYANIALQSGKNLLELINDILDLSKIEAGKIDLQTSSFSVEGTVGSIFENFRHQLREKQLTAEYSIAEEIPGTIIGDQSRLRQILFNLIGNAVKFTEEGGIVCRVSKTGGPETNASIHLLFSVEDTGIGIPEESRRKIFDPFTQADASSSKQFQGTGLGLSIVKRLVRIMGGKIQLDTEEGKGSRFFFTLPFKLPEDKGCRSARAVVPDVNEQESRRPLSILLVEDNRINRLLLKRMAAKHGHSVHTAENGRQALQAAQRKKYDIILMDIQMPVLDGIETVKLLRGSPDYSLNAETPVLALTAHAMEGDKERFLKIGMDGYIPKPVEPKVLFDHLDRFSRPHTRN